MTSVLIVEKDHELWLKIADAMRELGYSCIEADGYYSAMDALSAAYIDIVIAGLECGACEVCEDLRATSSTVPFLVLTSSPTKRDKREIFHSRADGYIELPFDPEELQMRVKSLLWRCHVEDSATVRYGECRLRTDTLTLEAGEESIELRRMEFLLLEKLLSYPGRIFSRAQLLDMLWGYDCASDPRTVDSHVRTLRKKLKSVGTIRIQTIRGIGYRAALPKK